MKSLESKFHQAIERRAKLSKITNAVRLVNGAGDGMEGLLIDRYNKHFQLQMLSETWPQQKDKLTGLIKEAFPVEYLIVKARSGVDFTDEIIVKGEASAIVEEYGLTFEVNLNDGLNCGLFLDMRHNRRMVGQVCRNKKVLNCFSYTCSFGVHARAAGAAEVLNTDISRKTLDRGRRNYELNGFSEAKGEFIKTDSMAFLQRAFKKSNNFDVVILDPPSFARHEGQTFQVKRDLPKAMALAVAVLNPGGALFVSSNFSELTHADLERILSKGLNGRRVKSIERVGQDEDFVGANSFKESHLVGLWVRFL